MSLLNPYYQYKTNILYTWVLIIGALVAFAITFLVLTQVIQWELAWAMSSSYTYDTETIGALDDLWYIIPLFCLVGLLIFAVLQAQRQKNINQGNY